MFHREKWFDFEGWMFNLSDKVGTAVNKLEKLRGTNLWAYISYTF